MNGMRVSILLASSLLMGCEKAEPPQDPDAVKKLPLMLAIADQQEWLIITISNKSPRPIKINGLMRLGGKTPELALFLDGKPAAKNKDTHYFTMPPVDTEPAVELEAEKSFGIIVRKEYLPSMYVFPKGSCKEVQVFYRDQTNLPGAFVGKISSNKLKICV